jgi:hypothetical protein
MRRLKAQWKRKLGNSSGTCSRRPVGGARFAFTFLRAVIMLTPPTEDNGKNPRTTFAADVLN